MAATATSPKPRISAPHRAALEGNPWFTSMPRAQREALLGAAELIHVRRGTMVFRQGDPIHAAGGGFYGLVAGSIKISSLRQDGREAILAVLEPGNWFGEITLIDGSPRTHDATALEALDLLVVPPEAFARQMRDVVFSNAIAAMLAARVRMLYGLAEDATLRSRCATRRRDAVGESAPHAHAAAGGAGDDARRDAANVVERTQCAGG
jgi:CRP/FNR family cyclic AMP-dependent transcriptional regulator